MSKYYRTSFKLFFLSILIILLSYTSLLHSQSCTYTWNLQPTGTLSAFQTVKAVNETVCWAAGLNGHVKKTSDGGNSWNNANPNNGITGNIISIEAFDANTAWIVSTLSGNTYIYKTINGGTNWLQVYTANIGFINGIKMENTNEGMVLGDPINGIWNIMRTTNGGLNWVPIATQPASQGGESGFRNSFHVSLPNIWFGSSFGSVYKSTDNGLTWSNHITPGIHIYVLSVNFNNSSLGFASGSQGLVRSTDGGANYIQHPSLGVGNIDNVEVSGNNVWYVRGQNIYYSSNAGEGWIIAQTSQSTMLDIDFVDNPSGCLVGWAVGMGGSVYKMTGGLVSITGNNSTIPSNYSLEQNYPNPFNPETHISFSLPKAGHTELKVYNTLGNEISTIVSSNLDPGSYNINFNAENLPSGVYVYKLTSGDYSESKKMILIK